MKKILAILPATLLALSLTACSDDEAPGTPEPGPEPTGMAQPVEPSKDIGPTSDFTAGKFFTTLYPKDWKEITEPGEITEPIAFKELVKAYSEAQGDKNFATNLSVVRSPIEKAPNGDEAVEIFEDSVNGLVQSNEFINQVDIDGAPGYIFVSKNKPEGADFELTLYHLQVYKDKQVFTLMVATADPEAGKAVFDTAVKNWAWTA